MKEPVEGALVKGGMVDQVEGRKVRSNRIDRPIIADGLIRMLPEQFGNQLFFNLLFFSAKNRSFGLSVENLPGIL
jgi:hypothetical protein